MSFNVKSAAVMAECKLSCVEASQADIQTPVKKINLITIQSSVIITRCFYTINLLSQSEYNICNDEIIQQINCLDFNEMAFRKK